MYLLYRAIYNANYSKTKKFQTTKVNTSNIEVNTIIKRNNKKNTEENI